MNDRIQSLSKSILVNRGLKLSAILLLGASLSYSVFSLYVSHFNYPGGTALRFFNRDYGKPGEVII